MPDGICYEIISWAIQYEMSNMWVSHRDTLLLRDMGRHTSWGMSAGLVPTTGRHKWRLTSLGMYGCSCHITTRYPSYPVHCNYDILLPHLPRSISILPMMASSPRTEQSCWMWDVAMHLWCNAWALKSNQHILLCGTDHSGMKLNGSFCAWAQPHW